MSILPKIKQCPLCRSINLIVVNGTSSENNFKSLSDWILKKKFNCRKCKIELGFFLHNEVKKDKIVWIDFLKCEDDHHNLLKNLQKDKLRLKKNTKKYYKTLEEIRNIQNEINLSRVKLKIKYKIQHKGMLVRHVY